MRFEEAELTKEQEEAIEISAKNLVELTKNKATAIDGLSLYVAQAKSYLEITNRQSSLMDKLEVIESKINKIIKD